jgi:hypothetical protein
MPPEEQPQTVSKCADIRDSMQRNIFKQMQDYHITQMSELGGIKEEIAFRKGQEEALVKNAIAQYQKNNGNGNNGNGQKKEVAVSTNETKSKKDIMIEILIHWGPSIIFLSALGALFLFKAKGWIN